MYKEIDRNKKITFLILFVFVLFVLAVGYFYSLISDTGWFGLVAGMIVAFPTVWIGYYNSDKMVLFMAGAKYIEKKDNPVLYNTVENLSIAAGLPTPKVYIVEDQAMNAFATGRDPQHAVVAVTTGLLSKLEKRELEGVIAHELSHIKNFDTRLGTIVVIFVGLVVILADWFWHFGSLSRRDSKKDGGGILVILGILFILLSPLVAQIMQLALSRNREYLADADAALLTRFPDGLIGALEKISNQDVLLRRANNAMNHMYIVDPIKSLAGSKKTSWFENLFSTHPPVDERINRLKNMI